VAAALISDGLCGVACLGDGVYQTKKRSNANMHAVTVSLTRPRRVKEAG
jgi:hypothetical protein